MSSCRLNTGCRVDRKQVTSTLFRAPPTCARFDSFWKTFRSPWASAQRLRLQRFAFAHLLIAHLTAQVRLFPIAHHHTS